MLIVADGALQYLPFGALPAPETEKDRDEVFSKNGLKARADRAGDFVIVNLPVSRLRNGDNVLALSGISLAGEIDPLGKSLIKVIKR
jgi:hypothetical protein